MERMIKNKKPQWRKIFDIEYPTYGAGRLVVYSDWIAYGNIGFNPKVHYKEVMKREQDKIKALKLAYKKWQEEFVKASQ
jgi:hypothetical protein